MGRLVFVLDLLAGCGGSQAAPPAQPTQLQCTIDGRQEMRVMRDCTSDLSYQERNLEARVEAFGVELGGESHVQYRPVKNSLMMLLEQQRSMCRDWNACALAREEYVQRSEWLTSQFTTLTQLLDAASPGTMQDAAARERIVAQVLEWAQRAQQLEMTARVEERRNDVAAQEVAVQAEGNEILGARAGFEAQAAGSQTQSAGALERQAGAEEEAARLQREMLERQMRAQAEIDAQNRQARAGMRAQFLVQIEQFERQARDVNAFVPLFERGRGELGGLGQGKRPRICTSDFKARLETAKRGENQSIVDIAGRLLEQVGRLCGPFDLWERPDVEVLGLLQRVPQSLENDERMASDRSSSPEDVKARVVAKIQQARREIAGTEAGRRPFPCHARVWEELSELSRAGNGWLNTATDRALRNREGVCQRIGVLPRNLEQNQQSFLRLLDSYEGTLRGQARTFQETADRFRASLPAE